MVKNLLANAGDVGSIPGSGKSPGEGNGNPLQSSYLGNLIDRGAWQAAVLGVPKESDRVEQRSTHVCVYIYIYILFQIIFHYR